MRIVIWGVMGLALAACSRAQNGPALAPSAGQPAYALRYQDAVAECSKAVNDGRDQEHKLSAGFAARADELKKPDWDLVRNVVDASDNAGKSADFADGHKGIDSVRLFWGEEKGTIDGRVVGATQHAVKQANCASDCTNQDIGGPAAAALNESIDKEIQKRLRARNDAFVLIERQRSSLGPANVATLEKMADDIAEASYLVHVDLVVQADRLDHLVSDRNAVKSTLDHVISDEQAYQATPGRTDADKKASDERIAGANKRKADIDAAAPQADALDKSTNDQIAAASKDYQDALDGLKSKIDQKKKLGG